MNNSIVCPPTAWQAAWTVCAEFTLLALVQLVWSVDGLDVMVAVILRKDLPPTEWATNCHPQLSYYMNCKPLDMLLSCPCLLEHRRNKMNRNEQTNQLRHDEK